MGIWCAYGVAPSLMWLCWEHMGQLKVLSWNCSRRNCSNLGMFSSVAANSKLLNYWGMPGNALVLLWVHIDDIVDGLDVEWDLKIQLLGFMVGCPLVKGTVVVI